MRRVLGGTGGYTLIELLVSIAILGILAGTVIIAVNPGRQIGQASDAAREAHSRAVIDAVIQYVTDHQGLLPPQLPTSARVIGTCTSAVCPARPAAAGRPCVPLDLPGDQTTADLVPSYLAGLPRDTLSPDLSATGYYIYRRVSTNAVTVGACYANTSLELTR